MAIEMKTTEAQRNRKLLFCIKTLRAVQNDLGYMSLDESVRDMIEEALTPIGGWQAGLARINTETQPRVGYLEENQMDDKFAHNYMLLKDIPGYKAGRTINWHGATQRFYFRKISEWKHDNGAEGIYLDFDGPKFTVDQVHDTEWFEPKGELVDFIPPFPNHAVLDQYVDLIPDCHLVDDVDQCRAINMMLRDAGFQRRLYEFYREQYNLFHGLKEETNVN